MTILALDKIECQFSFNIATLGVQFQDYWPSIFSSFCLTAGHSESRML